MSIFSFLKDLITEIEVSKSLKTVKDLDLLDDVWIKEDNVIYKGWIFDISRRHITVIYDNAQRDYKFQLLKPLNRLTIEQDNKILYCNEPKNNRSS